MPFSASTDGLAPAPSLHKPFSGPILRRGRNALLLVLGLVAGAYWFGASGVALGLLWWRARSSQASPVPPVPDPEALLASPTLRAVHLTPWRALFVDGESGWQEIFADELTPHAWARLRRLALTGAAP